MKRWLQLWVSAAVVVLLAILEGWLTTQLAEAELLEVFLMQQRLGTPLLAAAAMMLRFALITVAPGWLLYCAIAPVLLRSNQGA